MKKIARPRIAKPARVKRLPRDGGHTAFPAGGDKAFRDPSTMVMPDQAFSGAMAQPQGGAGPVPPAMPEG